jgi:hypothetical protein
MKLFMLLDKGIRLDVDLPGVVAVIAKSTMRKGEERSLTECEYSNIHG